MKKFLLILVALVASACTTVSTTPAAPMTATQVAGLNAQTWAQKCMAYGLAVEVATAALKANAMSPQAVQAINLAIVPPAPQVSFTDLCRGPVPVDTAAQIQSITTAISTLTLNAVITGSSK